MQKSIMFGILITVLNNKKVTVNELSLKYEISKRTVLRYIQDLSVAKIPIITLQGRNGGVAIADNYSLDRMFFTEKEMKRLYDGVNSITNLFNDKTSCSLKEKLKCMNCKENKQILATDTILIDSGPWGDIKSYKDKFNVLEKSINSNIEVVIIYHDVNGIETERNVQPYTLVFKKGLWYVYAYCLLRNEYRLFKIGRIAKISLTDNIFKRKAIDVKNLPYNLKWFENDNNINVVFQISPDIKSEIEEWLSFENVKRNKDGKIYAFARLPENGLVHKILSYGNKIKVIEPFSLKQKLINTVNGIEKLYNLQ